MLPLRLFSFIGVLALRALIISTVLLLTDEEGLT
jgi:hypothetical protein